MSKRSELHEILCGIINITESNGDRHTYFNPPASFIMKYPAIRYRRKRIDKTIANNSMYGYRDVYEIILIDENPDSEYVYKILQLPYCSHDTSYTADNLNHDVFTIYY